MGIGLDALRTVGRGRRARWIAAGLALTALGASVSAYAATRDQPAAAATLASSTVGRGPVTVGIAATGTAVPAQTRGLGFAVSGTVVSIAVQPGDTVSLGQELAAVDDATAQEKVTQTRDDLADAQDGLAEAREAADDQAACLATTSAAAGRPVNLAYSTGDGTDAADTSTSLIAVASLAAGPSPSPSPTRTPGPTARPTPTASRPSTSTSPVKPGGDTGAVKPGGDTGAAPSQTSQDTCSTRTGGGDQILSAQQRVNSAQQQADEAAEQLDGTVVTAPFSGKVLSVSGTVGSAVSAGGTFIELADVNGMQVSAKFPEADAGRLETRQKAVVTLPARPDEQFAATVVQMDPVGTTSGTMVTYGALLAFTDAPGEILVGQSANVRVTTAEVTNVLRVPATAVHDIRDGAGEVLVRSASGSARRAVRVGLSGDQYIEITSGLTEGEEVLTSW